MKKNNGISLISLIVTIIVLLILAGISITTLTGENGLIKRASNAKQSNEISEEKEIVEKSLVEAKGKNSRGNLTLEEFKLALDKNAGEGKTNVTEDDKFIVEFIESNRYYKVNSNDNVNEFEIIKDKFPGNIKKDKDGNELNGDDKPFEIWCIEDLVEWSRNYNNYKNYNINLCTTLNFKSKLSYADSQRIDYGDINGNGTVQTLIEELQSGTGFKPIETFSKVFDGKNHEIQNIYINTTQKAGLFNTSTGTIKNVGVSGNISSKGDCAGGIVAYGGGDLIINNCYNLANITSQSRAGGIIGYQYTNTRKCINCYNEGKIEGAEAGGIVGRTTAGSLYIYNCYNIGEIIATENGGGILGYKYHTTTLEIKNCYNYANVEGNNNKGQIIGFNWGTSGIAENVFYMYENLAALGGYGGFSTGTATFRNYSDNDELVDILNDYAETVESEYVWNRWTLGKDNCPIFE